MRILCDIAFGVLTAFAVAAGHPDTGPRAPAGSEDTRRGSLSVSSNPSDAEILLDGAHTGKKTPAVLEDIPAGVHTLEVMVPEYLFERQRVRVPADSTVQVSFQLISSFDTAYVIGDLTVGVLSLPRLPQASPPYSVDGVAARSHDIVLNEGKHRVEWNWPMKYEPLDTVVEVVRAKVTSFTFSPRRCTGILVVSPRPSDAEVIVGEQSHGYGEFNRVVPTGAYRIAVTRPGYYPRTRYVDVLPGRRTLVEVELAAVPDRDGDGFLDSIDGCPDIWGIYGGCRTPRFSDALRQNVKRIRDNVREDSLTISMNMIGYIHRTPASTRFREILGYYNDGGGIMNNVDGVTAANTMAVSIRGLIVECELGQYNAGCRYRKRDTVRISGNGPQYMILYDSLAGITPAIVIPGTALSAGLHFRTGPIDIAYTLGRQWEDIIFSDLVVQPGLSTDTIVFDNDWWFHQLHLTVCFPLGSFVRPALFAKFKLPFGSGYRTGWQSAECGVKLQFKPQSLRRTRAPARGAKEGK